ncbi:MAG TPA: hypothetical protein DCR20_00300 [Planctomycetaceae bacterium]|jgi:hypothetical protein|nr:hypothetical protein [Planctomycetaceae bacterium]
MSESTVSGQVLLIEPVRSFGQSGFRKRTVVLQQARGKTTNYVPLDFVGDACNSVDDLREGDVIRVNYRLSGRRWQRDESTEVRYFLSVEALSFDFVEDTRPAARPAGGSERRGNRNAQAAEASF